MVSIYCLCVDAHDPQMLAAFWRDVLNWRITTEDDDEVVLQPAEHDVSPHQLPFLFLRVPEEKSGKNRLHLDLTSEDQAAEVARIEALGAKRVSIGQTDAVAWVVLADPEGNEFCIVPPPRGR